MIEGVQRGQAREEAQRALALGDPLLCQSICLDLLDAHPGDPEVTTWLLQAMAESPGGLRVGDVSVEGLLADVADPVARRLLRGMLAYQRALTLLSEQVPGFVVRGWLDQALAHFDAVLEVEPTHLQAGLRRSLVARLLHGNPALSSER